MLYVHVYIVLGRVRVAVRLRPRNSEELVSDADFADCVELQPEVYICTHINVLIYIYSFNTKLYGSQVIPYLQLIRIAQKVEAAEEQLGCRYVRVRRSSDRVRVSKACLRSRGKAGRGGM